MSDDTRDLRLCLYLPDSVSSLICRSGEVERAAATAVVVVLDEAVEGVAEEGKAVGDEEARRTQMAPLQLSQSSRLYHLTIRVH